MILYEVMFNISKASKNRRYPSKMYHHVKMTLNLDHRNNPNITSESA